MQRYFASYNGANFEFSKDDIFHISTVMRMKIGDEIEVVSEDKLYLVKIISFNPFNVEIVKNIDETHELDGNIRLFICLLKGDKTEFVIQKAIELGVKEIVLVESSRCVVHIDKNKKESKLIRFNKVCKEALEQSKRTKNVQISDIISFKDINKYEADISLIPYENSESTLLSLNNDLKDIKGKTVNVIVGPEGGFSKEEVEFAMNCGFKNITLGKRILRAETANIFIVSLLSFYMGLNDE